MPSFVLLEANTTLWYLDNENIFYLAVLQRMVFYPLALNVPQ